MRRLAPGEFVGEMDRRIETSAGVICLIGAQPHIDPHEHADTHFVVLTEGWYRTAARGCDGVAEAGATLHNPPGTRHDDQFIGGGQLLTFSLSDALSRMALDLAADGPARVVTDPDARRALQAVREEVVVCDAASPLAVDCLAHEIIAALRPRRRRTRGAPAWLGRVRSRLEEACEDAPTVEALAREAGVHPVSFARAFRRHMGMSPKDWMLRARARRAAAMLAVSRAPLSEIAIACGFADQPAFTKAFAKTTGMAPGEFRRRSR
jgi:AraC family transcriptional regulator